MLIGIASKRAPVARFVSTAAIAVPNGLCRLKRRTQQRRMQRRSSFEQGSRRFGQRPDRLTNSIVDCLLTTQARGGVTMEGELVCVVAIRPAYYEPSSVGAKSYRHRI